MELPLFLLPLLALPLLLLFFVLGAAHLYHLLWYGRFHVSNVVAATLFLAYSAAILAAAAASLADVDWAGTFTISVPPLFAR